MDVVNGVFVVILCVCVAFMAILITIECGDWLLSTKDVGIFMENKYSVYSVIMERDNGKDRILFSSENYEEAKTVYMSYPDSLRIALIGE